MNYRISYTGTEGVRLQQIADMMVLPFIGTFLSCILLFVGLGIVINSSTASSIGWAFLCAVPLFAIAPWFIAGKSQKLAPQHIVFDNTKAIVAFVQQSRLSRARAYLAYQDIAQFDYVEVFGSSNDGTVTRTRAYVVRCIRRNGMPWNIASFTSEKKAAAMAETLITSVALQKHCRSVPLEALPTHITRTSSAEESIFSWQEKTSWGMLAFVVLFFSTFFSLLYYMSKSADFGVMLWIIGGVGAIIAIVFIIGSIRGIGGSQVIRITPTNIELISKNRNNNEVQHQTFALDDIIAADIDFSGNDVQNTLRFFTKQYKDEIDKLLEGGLSISGLWNSMKSGFHLPTVRIGFLSVAELLGVEHHLNREIQRHKNQPTLYTEHTQGMYWWEEHQPHSLTRWFVANRTVGITTLLLAPLPIFSIAALIVPNDTSLALSLYRAYMVTEVLRLLFSVFAGYRLWKYAQKKLRGGLLIVLPCCTAALALNGTNTYALWCVFLLIIPMVAGGITLLSTPDDTTDI